MVRLTKIYTRTGDGGTTRLVGGQEVRKDSLRIASYGTVDELNACIGLVRVESDRSQAIPPETQAWISTWLEGVQQTLFNVGSDLATLIEDRWENQPLATQDDVVALEKAIDMMNSELEPLNSFVLPGGGPVCAMLHLARTVCRRAERAVIELSAEEAIGESVIPYINRLSDALFVASRWVAGRAGQDETLWTL